MLSVRAISLRQQFLGAQHPGVAEALQDLAQLRQMQQQPIEALSLSQQALAILEKRFGPHHPRTLKAREALSKVEEQMSEGPQTTGKQ